MSFRRTLNRSLAAFASALLTEQPRNIARVQLYNRSLSHFIRFSAEQHVHLIDDLQPLLLSNYTSQLEQQFALICEHRRLSADRIRLLRYTDRLRTWLQWMHRAEWTLIDLSQFVPRSKLTSHRWAVNPSARRPRTTKSISPCGRSFSPLGASSSGTLSAI